MPLGQPQKNHEAFLEEVFSGKPSEIRLQQIVKQLKKDKTSSPCDDAVHEVLGVALMRLNRVEQAIPELVTAFRMSPCESYANNLLLGYREADKLNEGLKFNINNLDYIRGCLATSVILAGDYSEHIIDLLEGDDVSVVRAALESGMQNELTSIFRFLVEITPYGTGYSFESDKEEGHWIIDISISLNSEESEAVSFSKQISRALSQKYSPEVLMKIVPLISYQVAA